MVSKSYIRRKGLVKGGIEEQIAEIRACLNYVKALLEGQVRFQPADEDKTSSHEEEEDVNQFPF